MGRENNGYTEDSAWQDYRTTRSQDARNFLIVAYQGFVRNVAGSLKNRLPRPAMDIDDAISAGNMGLIRGIKNFSPERGASPKTYLGNRIKDAIKKAIIHHLRKRHAPIIQDGEEYPEPIDPRKDSNPYVLLEKKEARTLLGISLSELPERYREIVEMFYFYGIPQSEIAGAQGCTKQHINFMHNRTLRGLEKILGKRLSA